MAINFNAPSQVRPYANLAAFPATGAVKTVYIAEDTNKIYRWTGSAYVELSETDTTTWGSITGTLSAQTDLQTALDAKFDEPTGNATQYLDGAGAPTTFPTALPPSGTAGGDLTGTYPNPTVHRIHGIDVQNGTPSADDVLVYGGSPAKWQHQHLNASQVDNDSSVTGTSVELALEHLDSTKVPTTRTLTINGTTQDLSADRTFTISTGITIGTTAITSGTNGRFLFDDAGVVSETNGAFWDKVNGRWGIGTSSPLNPLHIKGVSDVLNIDNAGGRYTTAILSNNGTGKVQWTFDNNTNLVYFGPYSTNGGLVLRSNGVDRMTIFGSTGNIGINTTTDAGFKLDVNGTARVQSFIMVNRTSNSNDAVAVFNPTGTLSASNLQYQIGLFGGLSNLYIAYNNGSTTQTIFRYIQSTNVSEYLTSLTTTGYIAANASAYFASNGGSEVVIGTSGSVNSALLNVQSTTRGFLPPRMTTTQKNAIASPAEGLQVWDTTLKLMFVYNGTTWISL